MSNSTIAQRWDDCAKIAKNLGITKNKVYTCLYSDIQEGGNVQAAIDGDTAVLNWIRGLPSFARMHVKKDKEVWTDITTPAGRLKLAMWYIDKIGGPDIAFKTLKIAVAALQESDDVTKASDTPA